MPQLDSSTFVSQFFWLIVCFSAMWLLVAVFIVPRVGNIINRRQHKIDSYIATAEEFKQNTVDLVKRYDTAMQKAATAADEAWGKTRAELSEQSQKLQDEMAAKMKARLEANREELQQTQAEIKRQVDDIAVATAEKIIAKLGLNIKVDKSSSEAERDVLHD